ncbi:2',3'-cyclic-nucleotide 2'-phosphodiesterase (5'-nucleotidase family) [Conyzicola lurida]|uniref:2',3'-cyclic-nucleotide 2'-phosphodiesterase (5'-nucleotidase family) n=1 Tax=Conyzicola lurida TaxID=1172621 RepID=A0A841AQS5_9MICO|nr:2',3'-cyclic-nucleotide 2'-phosphodiesterase (5'-nucleotidase family) [Conyzicola lurida]
MTQSHRSRTRVGLAGALGLALAAVPLATAPAMAAPGDVVEISLLNINDFHGRIDENTVKFAGTVEQLRAAAGEANTLFLSDGDNIGASLFASSSQDDQPTIDVLNALELRTSAVGNHEFDKGFSDLAGRVATAADWSYLGANVYQKGTTTPALQEYEIFTVGGIDIAVIGAVTVETPTLVSPGGITTVDFGDPVAAVNRVAAQIDSAGLADVIVAEYHEGASAGTPDGATLEAELALDSAFTSIVQNTSASVDAIFTGHTHKQYSWDAPVPGVPGKTRPVLQTGNYGENIGQIALTVDATTGDVVSYVAGNVARTETDDAELIAAYPRVAEVNTIVTAALAAAATIGDQPIGSITADITTAFAEGERDDRASESTLGNLVANSLVTSLADETLGGAEIGVVNPGGLRSDLTFASSAVGEGDGVVTYAEANAVLPFVNNLWTTTLTGAQFATLLEQQWQLDENGDVPSRPFLNLGLSSNVNYTFDPAAAQGEHITSITVDGEPIDPARGYRIGSFSFLVLGGDNFREFANGTDTRDSGLIDRDAWIGYISASSPLSPDFARHGVAVSGVPASVEAGAEASLTLGTLDLTSLGSPTTTAVSLAFDGSAAAPVEAAFAADGALAFTVPADAPASTTLVVTSAESGTVVRVPLAVTQPAAAVPPVETEPAAAEPELAATGVDVGPAAGGAALLLMLGLTLLVVRRRREVAGSRR